MGTITAPPSAAANLNRASRTFPMGHVFLAIFLLVFGVNILFGLTLPVWITGLLAVIAGVILLFERFSVRVDRK